MSNGNGNAEGNRGGNEGDGQATAIAVKRAMAMVTRVACNKEDVSNGGKSDGNGDNGGGQATATRAMGMAMRVVSDRRQQGHWQQQQQQCAKWQQQQGWQATKRARARVTRAIVMAMAMRVAGNKEGKAIKCTMAVGKFVGIPIFPRDKGVRTG